VPGRVPRRRADQADSERKQVDAILDGVAALGAKYLLYSGVKYQDDAQLAADIETLNAIARSCAKRGVRLLYHNHDFEFAGERRAWQALTNDTVPELGFCPDVGWLHKGGQDCVAILESIRDRVIAVHFKEFRTAEPAERDFCCLGDGCVPFKAIADWVKGLDRDEIWVIAEQDRHDGPPAEAAKKNADFLRGVLQ